MFRRILVLVFFITFCKTFCFSQQKDTVMLMNGNVVVEKVIDTLFEHITVYHPTKVKKKLHYDFDDVYGIFYANGNKKYFYRQDTTRYMWFSRDEMFYFIKGEQDGRKGFKANGAMVGAGLLGFVGGATGSFFAPLAPYSFMALSGVTKIKIKHKTISNPTFIDSDAYILGYERSARYKRKLKSLFGGTAGLLLGYAVYFIFNDKYPSDYQNGKFVYK